MRVLVDRNDRSEQMIPTSEASGVHEVSAVSEEAAKARKHLFYWIIEE